MVRELRGIDIKADERTVQNSSGLEHVRQNPGEPEVEKQSEALEVGVFTEFPSSSHLAKVSALP